jgi:hypothetical protein
VTLGIVFVLAIADMVDDRKRRERKFYALIIERREEDGHMGTAVSRLSLRHVLLH